MRPDELERRLRERLDALGPAPRAELLHVLMLPDFERAAATEVSARRKDARLNLPRGRPLRLLATRFGSVKCQQLPASCGAPVRLRCPQLRSANSSQLRAAPPLSLRCPQLRWSGAREPRSCGDEPTDDETGWDRNRNPDTQENRQSPCHIASLRAPLPSRTSRKHGARESE